MKSFKSLVAAGLVVTGSAGLASAAVDHVYIVGAPAYRQDSIKTINAVVTSLSGGETASTSANSNFANASAVQWLIPNYQPGTDLVVNASFTGSSSGIESVAAQNVALGQKFIPDGTGSIASPVFGQTISEIHVPHFTLSDTFQETTPFLGNVTLRQGATGTSFNNYTFATLSKTPLGIEAYHFVGSRGLAARGVTNITTSQAQLLFTNGRLPLSFFTGLDTDENSFVYGLTRDPGSGARLILQAETGIGVKTPLKTYKPVVTGGNTDSAGNNVQGSISATTAPPLYPAGVIASTLVYDPNAGDTGYPKFGTVDTTGLLSAITAFPANTNQFYISYFNNADTVEAEAAGAEELNYNGVTYTTTAVAEGLYTFWSYEIYFPAATLSGNPLSFGNAVKAAFPANSSAPLSTVNVGRSVDGGPVTLN